MTKYTFNDPEKNFLKSIKEYVKNWQIHALTWKLCMFFSSDNYDYKSETTCMKITYTM